MFFFFIIIYYKLKIINCFFNCSQNIFFNVFISFFLGEEPFLRAISLNSIISYVDTLQNVIQDKNYGFNVDFASKKLNIGKFDEREKANLKKLELKADKWKLSLSAVLFDDISINEKQGNIFKITNKTKGLKVKRDIGFRIVYVPFKIILM